ncbi:DUF6199 family natural product biosynthesis protein [Mycolicibacterium litorale]|uniref:DUF6199 family natural product biosynthesis protein n=1 Tax=Mycolicibacterium litorale TaxID=758802 RepID=UPI003CEAF59F
MGSGVLIIVVGVAVGALMIAAPKGIWWATQSWKFRNPEVNEPSDAAYSMTRFGGVVFIVIALGLGGTIIADGGKKRADDRAQQEQDAAGAAFVPPPPDNRGGLPVVGYFAEPVPNGIAVSLYYLAPADSTSAQMRAMAKSMGTVDLSYPCYSSPRQTTDSDGRITFNTELVWAPKHLSDLDRADSCRMGRRHRVERVSLGPLPTLPPIVTDMPIANLDGTEIAPAAPGNAVPRLAEKPHINPSGSRPTFHIRGRIPIVGYQLRTARETPGERVLGITYLQPKDADTHPGDIGQPRMGCEVVPTITGLGTDTVTVDLWLYWSNPSGSYGEEDDERCVTDGDWAQPANTNWTQLTGNPTVLTNGPVSAPDGTVILPAAPGNRVP